MEKKICHEAKKNGISKEHLIKSLEEQWEIDI